MNFKSIIVLGLSVATLGLTLPAHADTANVVDTNQNAVITGNDNKTGQNIDTKIKNSQSGRRTPGGTGSSVTSGQSVDVLGDGNKTGQNTNTRIENTQRRR
ncbi:hypothetical protein [Chamaesiphon sp.]|uniref:hypothetical protein n=1 Tax=Chamaesiphon sp. TaxID=2814140 RepID=UPI0035933CE0